jgi:hypothetical protein
MDYNQAVQQVNSHMNANFHKFANILDYATNNKEEYFLGNINNEVRIWKKDLYGEITYLSDSVTIHEGVELFKRYVLSSAPKKYDYGDDIAKEIAERINDDNLEPKIGPDHLRLLFTEKIKNFAKSCDIMDYVNKPDGKIKCLGKIEVGPYKGYSIFNTYGSPSNRENVEYETDVVETLEDIQDCMSY